MALQVAPYTPPPPPPEINIWPGFTQTWTGYDRSVWPLTGVDSGVRLGMNVKGLHFPPVNRYKTRSPALRGSRRHGFNVDEREVLWANLKMYQDGGSQAWINYDSAFWETMHPDRPGVWAVTDPSGTTRRLGCVAVHDGQTVFRVDPSQIGWFSYAPALVADEEPMWVGDPVVQTWTPGDPQDFYGGPAHKGPPFFISSGATLQNAKMENPGDLDAFPVWTITAGAGGISSVSVGAAGKAVSYVAAIPEGDTRVIDSHPDQLSVVDQYGNDRISEVASTSKWGTIPPGQPTPLSLAMVGVGEVSARIDPVFYRAYGAQADYVSPSALAAAQ